MSVAKYFHGDLQQIIEKRKHEPRQRGNNSWSTKSAHLFWQAIFLLFVAHRYCDLSRADDEVRLPGAFVDAPIRASYFPLPLPHVAPELAVVYTAG